MNQSKVVVLGSTGFVGAALMKALSKRGHVEVQGYHSSDLDLTSEGSVQQLIDLLDERTVLIVATRGRQSQGSLDWLLDEVTVATNIARSLSKSSVKKCVYFSTFSVYGDAVTDLNITEETKIAPTNLYGVARYSGECIMRLTAEQAGIPLVVLRPCVIYGPGDHSQVYGPARCIGSILEDGKVFLFGDGTELRDHVFIEDVVRATVHLSSSDHTGTFNLVTGSSHSFEEVVAHLRKMWGREIEVIHMDRARPKVDQRAVPTKLLNAIPDFRFTELEQGLRRMWQAMSAQIVEV